MKTIFIAFPLIFLGAKFISNMYETPDTSGPMMDSPAYSGEEVEPANEGSFWMALADNSNAAPTRSFRFGPSLPDEAIAEAPLNEAPTPAPTETDNVFQANKVEEPVVVKEEKVEEPVKSQAEPVKAEPVKAQPIKLVYEDNVIISTEADFDHIIQKFEYAFVSFIVPWSSFCQTLRPEFQKAADIYAKKNKNVAFVWVDITLNLALKEKYGVARYPTMMLFKKGNNKPAVFTNTRTSHAMETYLDSQVKPVNAKPAQKAKPAQNSKPTQNAKPAQNNKPAQNSKPAQNNTNQAQKPVSA